MEKLFNKSGFFMKMLLCHNMIYIDLLIFGSLLLCWKQGVNPTGLVKYAIIFYGSEGIITGAIKIFKTKFVSKKEN